MRKITVLIVDDSPTMCAVIKTVLRNDPQIEVVGDARDPYEAREKIKALNPDVLTLDIEMPRMSGLQFLKKIMELRPMPVIMISSLTQAGASDAIEALSIGAFDYMAKPKGGNYIEALARLPKVVKAAAKYKPKGLLKNSKTLKKEPAPSTFDRSFIPNDRIIAIGSSTGGVDALRALLSGFPANCPPTIITQHMPQSFLETFAARLNRVTEPNVSLAQDGAVLRPGQIYIAPGSEHHLEITGRTKITCRLLNAPAVSGHRPSVDVMMKSVASVVRGKAIGVILTGMGRDGARGLLEIRRAGGYTIGQDEASSVVYGMPKFAFEIGAVVKQLPLRKISAEIISLSAAEPKSRCSI